MNENELCVYSALLRLANELRNYRFVCGDEEELFKEAATLLYARSQAIAEPITG